MPVHVVLDGASSGAQVPAQLMRIPISRISATTDCCDKYVKGKVVHKGPLVALGDEEFVLKTVIQEEDSHQSSSSEHTSINMVLFGSAAKEFSEAVNQEDVVVVAGFTVGNSPTAQKDNLHPCNLNLSGDHACLYVLRFLLRASQSPAAKTKRSSSPVPEGAKSAKVFKYMYAPLSDLKRGAVVNVYGVVVFFKQPFKTRGTDFCSSLKITDQSNQRVGCTIFCEKLEDHPKIFQMGDIIRMHRVKIQSFGGSVNLVNTFGFSVVTFDGRPGGAVVPRTSSKTFNFDQEDRRAVESLRIWAADQDFLPAVTKIPLSAVQPKAYFDLTCQLLFKAPIDTTCTLLKVWDGTKCPHPLLDVLVEPSTIEGPPSLSKERLDMAVNVLVYDNHAEVARNLKPGAYLRIYNIHANTNPTSNKVPATSERSSGQADPLVFVLHGGTSYGRGVRILPDDSPDMQELQRVVESFPQDTMTDSELNDCMMEVWSTPPESPEAFQEQFVTERTCSHALKQLTLAEVKQSGPDQTFHVRAQLRSYRPQRLHQSLKLHCTKCKSIKEVPDDVFLSGVFSEASRTQGPISEPWLQSGTVNLPGRRPQSPCRALTVLLATELIGMGKTKEIVFLSGSTLGEACHLAEAYQFVIPVTSSQGGVSLLDLSAPFLFQGRKRIYGCKRCSHVVMKEPDGDGVERLDEKMIAEAMGVVPLQYGLLMQFELHDGTETLEALLWRDAESFFHVSPEDAATSQEAQNRIRRTVDALCPGGSGVAEQPWMDLCLSSYLVEKDGHDHVCYQICHSSATQAQH